MSNATEITFPLIGFTYGTRTDIARRILTNKDAALLILAANDGTMNVGDIKALLRGWRPFGDGSKDGVRYATGELHFSYLFNAYYGHIVTNYDRTAGCKHYSSGAYMWRPARHTAAISALGRARLRVLAAQAAKAGVSLEPEVVVSAAKAA